MRMKKKIATAEATHSVFGGSLNPLGTFTLAQMRKLFIASG